MRQFLTAALLIMPAALAAGIANASSIITVSGSGTSSENSIVLHRCVDCAGASPKPARSTYRVPSLSPGTQKTEIVDINGEKKLVRTEAWSGGSPVVFVSKVPTWLDKASAVADIHPAKDQSTEADLVAMPSRADDGIDTSATTSALEKTKEDLRAPQGTDAAGAPLSLNKIELRPSQGN